MAGPVHDAEVLGDFTIAIWTAQARLYRLTATATNESDQNKVKADQAGRRIIGRGDQNIAIGQLKLRSSSKAEC